MYIWKFTLTCYDFSELSDVIWAANLTAIDTFLYSELSVVSVYPVTRNLSTFSPAIWPTEGSSPGIWSTHRFTVVVSVCWLLKVLELSQERKSALRVTWFQQQYNCNMQRKGLVIHNSLLLKLSENFSLLWGKEKTEVSILGIVTFHTFLFKFYPWKLPKVIILVTSRTLKSVLRSTC